MFSHSIGIEVDWSKLYTLGRRLVRPPRPLHRGCRFSKKVANVALWTLTRNRAGKP